MKSIQTLYFLLLVILFFVNSEDYSYLNNLSICMHTNHASERGTEVSMYDYAIYLEKFYKMKVTIMFPKAILAPSKPQKRISLPRFQARFNVTLVGSEDLTDYDKYIELSTTAKALKCDLLYLQKSGEKRSCPNYPESFLPDMPTAIHAVFNYEKHGTTYAAVSSYLVRGYPHRHFVPLMVIGPTAEELAAATDLKDALNISSKAFVLCRHGGPDAFDIDFVYDALIESLTQHTADELHLIFLGQPTPFQAIVEGKSDYPRSYPHVHFLGVQTQAAEKERYFKTCDAMIHARGRGETFGLSIAEFSVRNKLVITRANTAGHEDNHISILKDTALYYHDKQSLVHIIDDLIKNGIPKKDSYNAYTAYEPWPVIEKFRQVFLDPIFAPKNSTLASGDNARFKDGMLIKTRKDRTVYLVENNKKRAFQSGNAFMSRGYEFGNIITVDEDELSDIDEGEPLN